MEAEDALFWVGMRVIHCQRCEKGEIYDYGGKKLRILGVGIISDDVICFGEGFSDFPVDVTKPLPLHITTLNYQNSEQMLVDTKG